MQILNVKAVLVLIIVLIAYFIYAYFVLSPQSYKYFSLINDGEGIINTAHVRDCLVTKQCQNILQEVVFERQFKRFRPAFWLTRVILQDVSGLNAPLQHQIRVYLVGSLMLITLYFCILDAGGGILSAVLGIGIFITNQNFTRWIMDLGGIEPFQLLFFALFSLAYLNIDKLRKLLRDLWINLILSLLCLFLLFLKENSIAVIPALVILGLAFGKETRKRLYVLVLPTLFFVIGILISSVAVKSAIVEAQYNFDPKFLLKNTLDWISLLANTLAPFLKTFVIFLIFALVVKKFLKSVFNYKYIFWLLTMFSFTAIMFPWPLVLSRFLFIAIFCFSIVSSIIFIKAVFYLAEKISRLANYWLFKPVYWVVVISILLYMFLSGFSINLAESLNFKVRNQALLSFEHDQIKELANLHGQKIYLNAKDNLADWEVMYEIPIHLAYLYSQHPQVEFIPLKIPTDGFVLSRSGVDSVYDSNQLNMNKEVVIAEKQYVAQQIDTVSFRDKFKWHPFKTSVSPPLRKEPAQYYWNIRRYSP